MNIIHASSLAPMLLLACGWSSHNDVEASCIGTGSRVELAGRLYLERRAGPPNYGESSGDSVRTIKVLRLSRPIDICTEVVAGTQYPGLPRVSEVQLVELNGASARPGPWHGRGRLRRAEIGSDYRTVIFLPGQ